MGAKQLLINRRNQLGFDYFDISQLLGVSWSEYNDIENFEIDEGEITLDILIGLSNNLGIELDELTKEIFHEDRPIFNPDKSLKELRESKGISKNQ
ncbi:MAG: helix-turn-helix transcriptional regulator, partial [FCB group bacterium]|nr:helix-turn-helix transcriptional regulator [FCB group bacterium]